MQPKIAIGCPVRNRAWVLPEYLRALTKTCMTLDFDPIFLFLENDSEDDTIGALNAFADFMRTVPPKTECIVESISTKSELWNRGDYAHNQYANLANVRNQFLEMFLRTDADYLLSVDSDVIVPPDIVTQLLASAERLANKHPSGQATQQDFIIGAAISNIPNKPLDGETPGNFLKSSGGDAFHHAPYPMHGLHEVDLIGAVYLIPRQAIVDGCRYAPHGQGEDAPFCMMAQQKGYRLFVDMDVKCEHRMVKP